MITIISFVPLSPLRALGRLSPFVPLCLCAFVPSRLGEIRLDSPHD